MPDHPRPQPGFSPPGRDRGWPGRLDPVPDATPLGPYAGASRRIDLLPTGRREALIAPIGRGGVPQILPGRAAALDNGSRGDNTAATSEEAAQPEPRSAGHLRGDVPLSTRRYRVAAAVAVEEQRFLHRVTTHLVDCGVRQLLVVGGGPSTTAVLRLFRHVEPPLRMVHLGASGLSGRLTHRLLVDDTAGHPEPERSPLQRLLSRAEAQVLDRAEPMAVLLLGVLHLIPDRAAPFDAVAGLVRQLAPCSYLALSHLSADAATPQLQHGLRVHRRGGLEVQLRAPAEIGRFFAGLHLIEPGIELISRWRPDQPAAPAMDAVVTGLGSTGPTAPCYVGLGQVPGPDR